MNPGRNKMGYKYRNGSTPDHVISSGPGPDYPHVGQDTTKKKKVPVDTNQIKSNISKDYDMARLAQIDGNKKVMNKVLDNLSASQDTLKLARKGKIPAKP